MSNGTEAQVKLMESIIYLLDASGQLSVAEKIGVLETIKIAIVITESTGNRQ